MHNISSLLGKWFHLRGLQVIYFSSNVSHFDSPPNAFLNDIDKKNKVLSSVTRNPQLLKLQTRVPSELTSLLENLQSFSSYSSRLSDSRAS